MKWGKNRFEAVCHFCSRIIDPEQGIAIVRGQLEINFHSRCLKIMADSAAAENSIAVELVAPNTYGIKGAGPIVPPKSRQQTEDPKGPPPHAKIPPRRKPN